MGTLLQDLRFAWHTMRRTPAFALAAVLTLAIGIGATTAIFSTVNAVLLKPMPYPSAQDLYSIRTALPAGRVTSGLLSGVELVRLSDPALPLTGVAGMQGVDFTFLRNDGTPLKTKAYFVSTGFFDLFGLPMTLGGFSKQPPAPNGPPAGVVVSYRLWQDLYGGDTAIVGRAIRFAEISTTILGVAPRDFDTPHGVNFWFQTSLDPQGVGHVYEGFMRTKPGVNIERVRSEMAGNIAGVARDFPNDARERTYIVRPLVESIVGDLRPILLVVLSATGLLLLLACVNVTNLLLARGASRAREIAVRVAIGAGRGRIVRQLLTESMVLAAAGAVVGVCAAYAFMRLLLRMGAAQLPRLETLSFDGRVLLFALLTLFFSGVLVGFAPALRLAATDVNTLMNESSRSSSGGRSTARWLGALTVAEMALAVALVGGAGWLVRSFNNLNTVERGFSADGRLVFTLSLQGPNFRDGTALYAGFSQLLDRIRGLNGVGSAAAALYFPLSGVQDNGLFVHLQGDPTDTTHNFDAKQRSVSPGFFAAMGIKQLAGRDFTNDDRPGTRLVAIVNRTFAKRYLSGRDPLATQFNAGYPQIDQNVWNIVGVVDDVRQQSLSAPPDPAYYTVWGQTLSRRQTIVIYSRSGDSPALRTAIRDEVRKVDSQIPVDIDRVSDIVNSTLTRQQLGMTLMLVFAAAAIVLAAVGIYGVIAYGTTQRRRELAIRLALGATRRDIFWIVLKQGGALTAIGATLGLIVAYAAGRIVSSSLYAVRASDPIILGAATVVVVSLGLVATVIPAYRAAHLDPGQVLRPD